MTNFNHMTNEDKSETIEIPCEDCNGNGHYEDGTECYSCDGRGYLVGYTRSKISDEQTLMNILK